MPGCEPGGKGSTPFGYPDTRVCSWESRQPPKLLHGVRLLALVLMSRWCRGLHATLRSLQPWFKSRSHSVSDTLYGVFPFFACTFLLVDWIASRASQVAAQSQKASASVKVDCLDRC